MSLSELEHGDLIRLPDGKELSFHNLSAIQFGMYSLTNGGGYSPCTGTLYEIYNFLPNGSKVVMKDYPYSMKKIKPYLVIKRMNS